eukprot:c30211_g1_i1 orf=289-447(-)
MLRFPLFLPVISPTQLQLHSFNNCWIFIFPDSIIVLFVPHYATSLIMLLAMP